MTQAGIYIHIPFCRSRCSYCDFATGLYNSELAERYVRAITREIRNWKEVESAAEVDTIYFGGGTPSLLSPPQLESILEAVRDRFVVTPHAEITLEINPVTVQSPKSKVPSPVDDIGRWTLDIGQLRKIGIHRASFGVQTFDDRELARLGRSHTADDARQTFHALREAGFDNISFDLIAGLPGQTLAGWQTNLDEAFALKPEHLSFYLLEVHAGTPLAEHIKRGIQPKPDEELAVEMYESMLDRARTAGYEHYEISNLCLPGFQSRHNTKYWTGAPYFGFGCSAHSYDGEFCRWVNERDVARYVELIESERSPITQRTVLDEFEKRSESIFLGMRMMSGVSLRAFQDRHGVDLCASYQDEWQRFTEAGLVEVDGNVIRLTRHGALLSNEVFAAFV